MLYRLAIVGDVHGRWSAADTAWFDQAGYDLLVVVGDLAGIRWSGTLRVAAQLGKLTTRTLVLPGNHDSPHPLQLLSEVVGRPRLGDWFTGANGRRYADLLAALAPCEVGAYSQHIIGHGSDALTVLAGRPHPMGGPTLSFPGHLEATWGIGDLATSEARMRELIDRVETERVVFVGHNGPSGLGSRRDAIWGRDFHRDAGDWGDPDLAAAIDYARETGHRVLAVAGGHMHRKLHGGGQRQWLLERDGTAFVNAAEVPRIRGGRHHHVELIIEGDRVEVHDRWVDLRAAA